MRWVSLVIGLVFPILLAADEPLVRQVALNEPELTESSGLAFSLRDPQRVWTHNDSGDGPRLWCFDSTSGARTGSCQLDSASPIDWEAMTSFPSPIAKGATKPMLVVADCGDNQRNRSHVTLYLFDEPDPNADAVLSENQWGSLNVRFPGGPVDCEAMWFDADEQAFVFLAKSISPLVSAYALRTSSLDRTASDAVATCTKIATMAIPLATGGDRDPRTGDIWISTYWNAFCFSRGKPASNQESLRAQLSRTPSAHSMPAWKQIESIAVDDQSRVWITSEGTPAKLGLLNPHPR